MIIRTVLDMNNSIVDAAVEEPEPAEQFENDDSGIDIPPQLDESKQCENDKVIFSDSDDLTAEDFIWNDENAVTVDVDDTPKNKYYFKWSTAYKKACKLTYNKKSKHEDFQKAEQILLAESQTVNVLAIYDLGKLYSIDKFGAKDEEKSFAYYKEALSCFRELEIKDQADDNLFYKIGMMYENGLGTDMDISKAIKYFQKSADNMWSSYQLGRLYLFGTEGLEKDKEKAIEWLTKSADNGNEFAENMLNHIDDLENAMLANTIFGLFANLSRCIEEDYTQKYKSVRRTVDSRLRKMIHRKKQSLRIKDEQEQQFNY